MNNIQLIQWLYSHTSKACSKPLISSKESDADVPETFSRTDCIFCSSDDSLHKKLWKTVSADDTMEKMKDVLKGKDMSIFERDLEEILKNGTDISYEDVFKAFGKIDHSELTDDDNLENIIKKAVEVRKSDIPQNVKEEIFTAWDAILNQRKTV